MTNRRKNNGEKAAIEPRQQRRIRHRKFSARLAFLFLVMIFATILLWNRMVHTTPVGHSSVVWHRIFFNESENSRGPLREGVHVIQPWDEFYTYDMRLQTSDQVYEVVSGDGLHLQITLTFRWRPVRENLVTLNRVVGPNYLQTLLVPVVGSVAREVIAGHQAERLFGPARTAVQTEIYDKVITPNYANGIGERYTSSERWHLQQSQGHKTNGTDETSSNSADTDLTEAEAQAAEQELSRILSSNEERMVILEDVLIKRIILPLELRTAIERKLSEAQKVEEYEFRVERERLESRRKRIEAEGIRDFQHTVAPAITESYLRWRGIEATLELAKSNNAKVVVIGNSETGLPLILDTATGNSMPPPMGNSLGKSNDQTATAGQTPAGTSNAAASNAAPNTADPNTAAPNNAGPSANRIVPRDQNGPNGQGRSNNANGDHGLSGTGTGNSTGSGSGIQQSPPAGTSQSSHSGN
jgi:regulator of protease activity HflC (stomatin/prohibitin superfamily)